MKLVVWNDHLRGQILYRILDLSKKRHQSFFYLNGVSLKFLRQIKGFGFLFKLVATGYIYIATTLYIRISLTVCQTAAPNRHQYRPHNISGHQNVKIFIFFISQKKISINFEKLIFFDLMKFWCLPYVLTLKRRQKYFLTFVWQFQYPGGALTNHLIQIFF